MGNRKRQFGMTGVEIIVAVGILAVLVAMVIGFGSRLRTQSNIQLTQSTITMLGTALEQYYDFTHSYPPDVNYATTTGNSHTRDIQKSLRASGLPYLKPSTMGPQYNYNDDFASIEVLYYYLNRVPQSRAVIRTLAPELVTSRADDVVNGKVQKIRPSDPNIVIDMQGGTTIDLPRVVDAWKSPLRYTHNRPNNAQDIESTNFPVVESAGPDRQFGTSDDISSKQN